MLPVAAVSLDVRAAVEDLYARYAKCLDDASFDQWPGFFTEQCVYKVQARENFDRGLPLALIALESRGMMKDRVYGVTQTIYHGPYYMRHVIGAARVMAADRDTVNAEDGGRRTLLYKS